MKAAWDSPDREAQLNRAVEVMASEGFTRDQLDEALVQLLLEIRSAGADDATEEIINCIGDRLHGWCHPSGHIKTISSTEAPESHLSVSPRSHPPGSGCNGTTL
jgi:hypothetical protein